MTPMEPPGESENPGAGRGEFPHTASDAYRAVFEEAPDGILLVDAEGTIRDVNREGLRLFRYSREGLVGSAVERLVPLEARGRHRRQREGYVEAPRNRPMGTGMELTGLRSDGSSFPVEISLSPLRRSAHGPVTIAIVRDLTERRRLRDFGSGSLRATEAERGRIARELHDDTAQILASLLVRLRVLETGAREPALEKELAELRMELRRAVEGIRRIARGLRPPELEDLGLAAALQAHVREQLPDEPVRLSFGPGEERLSPDAILAVYRIAQEALGNAARHSGADEILLRTEQKADALILEVWDDGRGFEPDRLKDPGAGLGLLGMQERAEIAGARLEVRSAPGEGTRIRLSVPLEEEPFPHAEESGVV